MPICKGCGRWIKFVQDIKNSQPGRPKWMACDSESYYSRGSGGMVVKRNGEVVAASSLKQEIRGFRLHTPNCSYLLNRKPTI